MSTESPKTWFFWSGNALPDPPCYDQFTDDDNGDDHDDDLHLQGEDDANGGEEEREERPGVQPAELIF